MKEHTSYQIEKMVKAVCDGKSYVIGRYSTHEKAIKAMEMCRKQYMDGEYNLKFTIWSC